MKSLPNAVADRSEICPYKKFAWNQTKDKSNPHIAQERSASNALLDGKSPLLRVIPYPGAGIPHCEGAAGLLSCSYAIQNFKKKQRRK
jgi:hypothetical protein